MNSSTGHVVSNLDLLPPAKRAGYELLPGWLRREAEKELRGKTERRIDLDADTPLARYAQSRRLAAESKRARKAAKRLADKRRQQLGTPGGRE